MMIRGLNRILLAGALSAVSMPALCQVPKRDPKVQALMDQILAAYKALPALHLKIAVKVTADPPSLLPPSIPVSAELRVQKPNRLWILSIAKQGAKFASIRLVCDGVNLWRWQSSSNTFRRTKAPKTFAEITDLPQAGFEPEVIVHGQDPFAALPYQVNLQGPQKRDGIDVDVLSIPLSANGAVAGANVTLFVGQKDHLVRGTLVESEGKDAAGKPFKVRIESTYEMLDSAPKFTAADFAFIPPAGAKAEPEPGAPKPAPSKPAAKPPVKPK